MRAKKFLNFLEERPIGYIPIDVKGLKDPDEELIDWLKKRLSKHRPEDYSSGVYFELEKLLKNLLAKRR